MPEQQNKVEIQIVVDKATGQVQVREFVADYDKGMDSVTSASDRATSRIAAGWQKLKAAWVEVVGGLYAVQQAWDSMQSAAKARQERQAFENMAASYGANGDAIIAKLKEVSGRTVDTMNLVRDAGTAMMMGIAPETVIKLMEIARSTTKQTGQTVTKAFGDISLAVGRQSRMILDNLGIIVEVEKANEEYAASLGKTSTQLTDAEKKQAFLNATIKGGAELMERLGEQTNNAADRMARFNAAFSNMKVGVGDFFIRIFQFVEGTARATAAFVLAVSEGIFGVLRDLGALMDKLPGFSGAAEFWQHAANAAFGAKWDLIEKANQAFKDALSTGEVAATVQKKIQAATQGATASIKEQEKAQKKLNEIRKEAFEAEKKEADLRRDANKEIYEKAGIDADAFYADEAAALIEKAAKWEAAGVEIGKINEYLYEQFGKMAEEAYEKGETAAGDYLDTMQAKSMVLVGEFQSMEEEALASLTSMGDAAAALDGTQIALNLTMNEDISSIVDRLTNKFNALKAAAIAAAAVTPAASSGSADASSAASGGGGETTGSASGESFGSYTIYEGNKAEGDTYNISVSPTYMTGDRASAREAAADISAEIKSLQRRRGEN